MDERRTSVRYLVGSMLAAAGVLVAYQISAYTRLRRARSDTASAPPSSG